MREWITNLLVIGLSVAFLWHFSNIAIRGVVTIQEPNTLILSLEIALMVGLIVFAIFNLIRQAKGK